MKIHPYGLLTAALLTATPAMAGETPVTLAQLAAKASEGTAPSGITLILENEAGMVTQVPDLTQRECDAIATLLTQRKSTAITVSSGYNSLAFTTQGAVTKAPTSRLSSFRCVVSQ